jgi:hypothetical protein
MANESAVLDIGQLETMKDCDGCGKSINLLSDHLVASAKSVRRVLMTVSASDVDTKEAQKLAKDSDVPVEMYYIGTKSGGADEFIAHDWNCLIQAVERYEDKNAKVEIHVGAPADDDEGEED